jgi:hypothetical protein
MSTEVVHIKPLQAARLQRMVDKVDWSEVFPDPDDRLLVDEVFRRITSSDAVPVTVLKRLVDILIAPSVALEVEADLQWLAEQDDDDPDDDWAA